MSRHILKHPHYEITLGWDAALETYFATVIALDNANEDEPLIWIGTMLREYPELAAFLDRLVEALTTAGISGVEVPASLLKALAADRDREGRTFAEKSREIKRFVVMKKS
jgi:hypothetical protein